MDDHEEPSLTPGHYVLRTGPSWGFSCEGGTVHRWQTDENGEREEWDEPLCESPIADVLPGWIWDLTVDPRIDD